jgi:hypothetical protein
VVHKEFRARKAWGAVRRGEVRRAAGMVIGWASLPVERMRLQRLAGKEKPAIAPLKAEMDTEEAARPSPQEERMKEEG